MWRIASVAFMVGLADSINPSTVAPGVYFAIGRRPIVRVALFTLGIFAVDMIAGVLLTVGPGRLLLGLVPHPRTTVKHAIELVAGILLLGVAVSLFVGRRRLARRELPMRGGGGGSALTAGASIAAVELPTAFPYFAVIATIVASSANLAQAIGMVALYCLGFVLPLIGIIVVLLVAGERADPWLERSGAWLQRRWPVVLAVLLLLIGGALTLLGAVGLVRD